MKFAALLAAVLSTGCYLKSYPVTADVAEAATYKMITYYDAGAAQGTAWAVNSHTVVTAGHMCEEGVRFELISSTDRHVLVTPILYERSDTNGNADLCVLHSDLELAATPLVIADAMPDIGTTVHYVGWPQGHFVREDGKYLGDMDGDDHLNDAVSSTPSDHGASGSAMFYDRGVFGVLVRLRTDGGYIHDGTDGSALAPLDELLSVLKEAGVDYVTTPSLPEQDPFTDRGED